MNKERTAQIVTVAVIAVVVSVIVVRQSFVGTPRSNNDPTPQDAIYAMLDAARDGNVNDYLEFYAGRMRTTLEQSIEEQGKGGFADYLRQSNASIKGIAINAPEELSPDSVKARVEYVFADRNEVQFMYLTRIDGRWRITGMEETRRIEPLVPYGTEVQ